MLERLEQNQQLFYKQAIVPLYLGKVHHAYLIETNSNDEQLIDSYIKEFCKIIILLKNKETNLLSEDKLINLIDTNNYPELINIYPESNMIKKERLLQVMNKFSTKSIYNNYQIYVIHNAEMLNKSASNTILKFLEEPEENIIAILLSTHRYKILPTILSRCIVMSLKKEKTFFLNENYSSILLELVNDFFSKEKPLILNFNKYYENLFQTKEQSIKTMKELSKIFQNYLENSSIKVQNINIDELSLSKVKLLKIIGIIDEFLVRLQYNVNIKLWLDSLFIKFTEVLNESFND